MERYINLNTLNCMNKRQIKVMILLFTLIASFGVGCANYGAFQGFTSDGLYISPSSIQSRVSEPQLITLSDTNSFWQTNYFSSVSKDSYLWEELLRSEFEELALVGLGMDIIEIDQSGFEGRGPALKTGWVLSERSQFFIINELGGRSPNTFFLLQTNIQPYWDVVFIQSGDARQGIDLQYRRDY